MTWSVVLVEDDDVFATLAARVLRDDELQAVVTRVATLEDFFQVWQESPADAVLADLGLPDSSGLDTLASIRLAVGRRAPVVVLTANDDYETSVAAARMGAQQYLRKEVDRLAQLPATVRWAIETHRRQERAQAIASRNRTTGLAQVAVLQDVLVGIDVHRGRTAVLQIKVVGFDSLRMIHGFGHASAVLGRIARRLCDAMPPSAEVVRPNLEELTVVLPGCVTLIDVEDAAERAHRAICTPISLDGRLATLDAWIGVAVCPDHTQDPFALARLADDAMEAARADEGAAIRLAVRPTADAT